MMIRGNVEPGFERVSEVFAENFRKRSEVGAAFCAFHEGRRVVDLVGGWADRAARRPWSNDTLVILFSATKGMTALAFVVLADRGLLDYDQPVIRYWPEFGAHGKTEITVRQLLNHRSGLNAIDRPLSLEDLADREILAPVLAAQEPVWPPGSDQGYCGVTYGLYAGELFHRIAGESLGTYLRREVFDPLGAEVYLGLPRALQHRVATLYKVSRRTRLKSLPGIFRGNTPEGRIARQVMDKTSVTYRAFSNPIELGFKAGNNFNSPRVHEMELPWMGALGNANGLATVYAALSMGGSLNGVRVCRAETLAPVHERQTFSSRDRVLQKPIGWSQGFIKEEKGLFSPNLESFGHPGMGGSMGFADPKAKLSFAYTMNQMDHRLRSPRAIVLAKALYSCV